MLVLLDWMVCGSLDQQQRLSGSWYSEQEPFAHVIVGTGSTRQGEVEDMVRGVR